MLSSTQSGRDQVALRSHHDAFAGLNGGRHNCQNGSTRSTVCLSGVLSAAPRPAVAWHNAGPTLAAGV
jgi:hypothetical protein